MTPAKIPEGSPMTAQGLSAERLAEIEARLAAATPGPWAFQKFAHTAAELEEIRSHGLTPIRLLTNDGEATIMAGEGDARRPVARAICHARFKRGEGYKAECEDRDANAAIIAHAPTDISDLHREVTRLRAIADGLAALVKRGKSWAMTSAAHRQDRWGREDEDRYIAEADAALSTYDSDKAGK